MSRHSYLPILKKLLTRSLDKQDVGECNNKCHEPDNSKQITKLLRMDCSLCVACCLTKLRAANTFSSEAKIVVVLAALTGCDSSIETVYID